ncbi:MAG: DUF1592 domain-containing protein [Akkermansiaceae bacterium]|nr:DUF1592 domain-containing protein [Akkermansiaceae bacterium]
MLKFSDGIDVLTRESSQDEGFGKSILKVRTLGLTFLMFLSALDGAEVLEVFHKNCVRCHGKEGKVKGKVNLLEVADLDHLKDDLELLQEIIDVIDFEEMPPEDEPPLEVGERKQLLADLEALRLEAVSKQKSFAPTPIRRMNRFQYHNAVQDLLGLNCTVYSLPERMIRDHKGYFKPASGKMDNLVRVGSRPLGKSQLIEPRLAGVAAFPQDLRAEHGFDTQADHLSMSPLLMESFLKLGQSITGSQDFGPRRVGIWKEFFVLDPRDKREVKVVVRERLQKFLRRAFRGWLKSEVVERYVDFVDVQLARGVEFTEAMKLVAAAIISSPRFVYLYEGSGSDGDGFELASRLSFFLWGSLPDEELLEAAESGELLKEEGLQKQFGRMLKDPKLKRFCDTFPAQWLQLDRIISSVPDPKKFPDFYFVAYRDSMHMMIEPLLLFETVLIENLPVTEFIDSSFTYRSGHLEEAYGELGNPAKKRRGQVGVLDFHRVPVEDRRIGGVITNAAVMTMTSGPERTQPITRGAWLAGVIFNNPPEPPPADVPTLGEKPKEGEEHLTLRERLSMHRERSDCRGCHEQIDPLGFALENFNAIGKWREKYENGRKVDMEGVLFRKHKFTNVIEFKDILLLEKERFVRGLAGHLLAFSLGRQLSPADQIALDEIVEKSAIEGYRMKSLLREVVFSKPFRAKASQANK